MAKRANEEGSIYQRKDGQWVGAAYVLMADGTRKRKVVYGKTRAEARDKLLDLQAKSKKGLPAAARTWKVDAYLDYWLANVVKPFRRTQTYSSYETNVRVHITPLLGAKRLDRLTIADVRTFLTALSESGASQHVIRSARATLRSALTNAVTEELVGRNVAGLVRISKPPRRRIVPWTTEEARTFLKLTASHRLYLAYMLVVLLGLRRGEALGVSWDDLDLDKGELHIRSQIQRDPGAKSLVRVPVKTDGSDAVIPLPTMLVEVLLERQRVQQYEQQRPGWQDWGNAHLVLTTLDGTPVDPRAFSRTFHLSCEKAGVRRIRLHDTRHTCASLLRQLGVDLSVIKEILRHAEISITADIYIHVSTDQQRDALNRISDALDEPLPAAGKLDLEPEEDEPSE